MTGNRGSRRAGQGKLRASLPSASAAGGARGAAPLLGRGAQSVGRWHPSPCLSLSPSLPLPISARPVRVGGLGHSPRRGAHRAAGPDAARSAAPPPRRPRNAAPHRAMQPGQRHNTPRDIRRPAIGRRAERRARRPLSAAVTPAAREGAAGSRSPHTLTQRSPRCPSQGSRSPRRRCRSGAGSGSGPGQSGAVPATAPAAAVHWPPGQRRESKLPCLGQRRGAAGCWLGPAPRTPSSPPITYSAELGEFHSEATARGARSCGRQQRIRAAPAGAVNTGSHPRGPRADGPGRRCPLGRPGAAGGGAARGCGGAPGGGPCRRNPRPGVAERPSPGRHRQHGRLHIGFP